MKWIRYLVPLLLVAVASTAYGQWFPTSGRYGTMPSASLNGPTTVRPYRLIVADDPANVAGKETVVMSDAGMAGDCCDSCGVGHCGKHGHCKHHKKHCCVARQACCAPVSCGCEKIVSSCDPCDTYVGKHHCKLFHHGCKQGCGKHHGCGAGKCCGMAGPAWSYGCGCNVMSDSYQGAPQPEPAGEPIEPRRAPTPGSTEPASKSALRGGQWPTWGSPTWSSPQPTRARPSSYEVRVR